MKYKPRIFLIKPPFICVDFLLFRVLCLLACRWHCFFIPIHINMCVCAIFLQASPANSRVVNVKLSLSRQKRTWWWWRWKIYGMSFEISRRKLIKCLFTGNLISSHSSSYSHTYTHTHV
jgi:hypothetical protein